MEDRDYMALALALAEKGAGWTCPNPMVGAVIVKDGRIIGQGYHRRCGELHAEREALVNCQEDPRGATLYVTLEPCCVPMGWRSPRVCWRRNAEGSTVFSSTISAPTGPMW